MSMTLEMYWVRELRPARLAIMPCPLGGMALKSTIAAMQTAGIDLVISLLEANEAADLGVSDEAALCKDAGIEFRSLPIPDQSVPASVATVADLARTVATRLRQGSAVAVHCRAGIGRSGVIAGAVLVELGFDVPNALRMLTRARGFNVPQTKQQEDWLQAYALRRGAGRPTLN